MWLSRATYAAAGEKLIPELNKTGTCFRAEGGTEFGSCDVSHTEDLGASEIIRTNMFVGGMVFCRFKNNFLNLFT